ncbi:hypothetical protein V5P93_003985 [Actinokineospora auranticolor]|uniref:Uncharacterized protein n=1 Tax=Actinokineospora auranticolor TaxID=155976 RepID=A0A2S6GB28_9PSEU|nr:hypothetical protein [Actinokineospora auranticolor]PPK60679.1 hypothetical protein CLV40_1496 [Actinokineospora auranticolor]
MLAARLQDRITRHGATDVVVSTGPTTSAAPTTRELLLEDNDRVLDRVEHMLPSALLDHTDHLVDVFPPPAPREPVTGNPEPTRHAPDNSPISGDPEPGSDNHHPARVPRAYRVTAGLSLTVALAAGLATVGPPSSPHADTGDSGFPALAAPAPTTSTRPVPSSPPPTTTVTTRTPLLTVPLNPDYPLLLLRPGLFPRGEHTTR